MMTKEREGEVMMVVLSLLESWFPILSMFAIALVGAIFSYAIIVLIATTVLMTILIEQKSVSQLWIPEAQKDLLLTSFFITALFLLIFLGLKYTSAGNMAVIIFLQLLFSYLFFNVFGSEKLTPLHSWGALSMGIGAIIMLFPDDVKLNIGDALILIAAIIAPFVNLYQKRARAHVSSITILAYRNLAALPFLFLIAWLFEPLPSLNALKEAMPYLFSVAILVYVISKILWIEALHRISITKMSAMLAILPLSTLTLAYFVLNEVPTMRQLLGIIPILFGGYLITRPVHKFLSIK